ncbi:MAG: hypothetical protein HRU24_15555 [Gammaproteobacteria bacterium]|nr:hypothetical protein [Gammaproteobacteria bacterium]
MNKLLILTLLTLFSTSALGTNEASGVTTITRIISYNQYGDGDVVFRIANPTSSCYGYWINKNDSGFNANLSLLIAARQAKTSIKVYGLTTQRWSGSGNLWCKLYAIEYNE